MASTQSNAPQAILGALAGDIIGSVYEFKNTKTEDFPLFSPDSRFTDDSVMTLAVAKALLDCDDEIPTSSALIDAMQQLGRAYPHAGYGGQFRKWLTSENPQPYNSWGNGSAMRVSAAGWYADTLEVVERIAKTTAEVTHNHEEGIRGAVATAGCILLARQGATNSEIRDYVEGHIGYSLDFTLDEIRPTYTFDVSCQGSVPQAIVAFLESSSFEDAVRKAVSIGGDSDTIGAIAASITQGRYEIPAWITNEVRERLGSDSDLLQINDAFCARFIHAG